MCGRYSQFSPRDDLVDRFAIDAVVADEVAPSWNVAPTDRVHAVVEHHGQRLLGAFRWGLVPSWVPNESGAKATGAMINARAETLDGKPAFRTAFARRRCIIPADGFYEWRRTGDGRKQPFFIRRPDRAILAFAGLYERRGDLRSCTIVTTRANAVIAPLHDRMPVILAPDAWDEWLDREQHDTAPLHHLLVPAPDDLLELVAVSPLVNSVRNNGPELLAPATESGEPGEHAPQLFD
jgi:putative SOS response-associated peptidase YedK